MSPSRSSHTLASVGVPSHGPRTRMSHALVFVIKAAVRLLRKEAYIRTIQIAAGKKSGMISTKMFPHRDSNPGLLGESQLS